MAKPIGWTHTAKRGRREILEYWIKYSGYPAYSIRLSKLFRTKVGLLAAQHYPGKPTDAEKVRVSLVSHFSVFYKVTANQIIIVGIWDNRRHPDDLRKNLELKKNIHG